jgi:hypothetical protein
MTGGMHFMDRYNFDTERVRRCVIQYSTPDGLYPFCTINTGPSTGRTSSDCTPGPSTRRESAWPRLADPPGGSGDPLFA